MREQNTSRRDLFVVVFFLFQRGEKMFQYNFFFDYNQVQPQRNHKITKENKT